MARAQTTYWIAHYKAHPTYVKYRLKELNTKYPRFDIEPEMIDNVDIEEFCRIDDNRIPFFLGSQFGIFPRINDLTGFFNGKKEIAVLSKSLLSGAVSGLSIYQIGEDEKEFSYNKIITFPNRPF